MTVAISTEHLSKTFGRTQAVSDLDLTVPEGSIFALLGPNGSGKTTTIKMILNLLRPSRGAARVLGTSSAHLGPREFRQIGYVSENQDVPTWMTARQLLHYCRPMYPGWDETYCDELRDQLDLPTDQPLGRLSRGARAKALLLSSLAYRPRLLVLDEPFGGLDPVVREEVLQTVRRVVREQGGSVFISSHDMEEVERLADWIGFLDGGVLVTSEPLTTLFARFRRVDVVLPPGVSLPPDMPASWAIPDVSGSRLTFIDTAFDEASSASRLRQALGDHAEWSAHAVSLSDVFRALTKTKRHQRSPS